MAQFSGVTSYESPRIHPHLLDTWKQLFIEGIKAHDDDWIAAETDRRSLLKSHEERKKPSGGYITAKVPHNAAQQLAEGEFNRFYLRGICARAIAEGKTHLRIYRGKEVRNPRLESEAKIGSLVSASDLLSELRNSDFVDNALGLPAGPNSGLTAEIA
jgi:hypothetical protein